MLSGDPRVLANTRPVNELTYDEATELAFFGAQVGWACLPEGPPVQRACVRAWKQRGSTHRQAVRRRLGSARCRERGAGACAQRLSRRPVRALASAPCRPAAAAPQVLHPLAMQPAIRSQAMDVRVKNSYNRAAPGTLISKARDMSCSLVTSIVLKNNVTLVDIVSSRMLGQFGEAARCTHATRAAHARARARSVTAPCAVLRVEAAAAAARAHAPGCCSGGAAAG